MSDATEMELDTSQLYINRLAKEIHTVAKSKGWWDEERSFGEVIALIHSELSEALECYRDGNSLGEVDHQRHAPDHYYGPVEKSTGIPIELADAIIRILDFCGRHEIDIAGAILAKMEYNKTRPHRHGNKKI